MSILCVDNQLIQTKTYFQDVRVSDGALDHAQLTLEHIRHNLKENLLNIRDSMNVMQTEYRSAMVTVDVLSDNLGIPMEYPW